MICQSCDNDILRINTGRTWGKQVRVFIDATGRAWHGSVCPDCKTTQSKNRRRYRMNRDAVGDPGNTTKRGLECENLVANLLTSQGFTVKQTTKKGPDIVATLGDLTLTVEVKKAVKNTNGNYYRTHKVCDKRKSDDLVAIVMPNGAVYIEHMSDHLSKCNDDGRRTITHIVSMFDKVGQSLV